MVELEELELQLQGGLVQEPERRLVSIQEEVARTVATELGLEEVLVERLGLELAVGLLLIDRLGPQDFRFRYD